MSNDLHPDDGGPVSGGGFYLRVAVAAILIVGGVTLLVWLANR